MPLWEPKGAGVVGKSLLEEYGTIAHWNGALGVRFFMRVRLGVIVMLTAVVQEDRLWIADPKAVHHILQVSCYQCEKDPYTRPIAEMLLDRGLAVAEGELAHILRALKPSDSGLRRCT